MPNRSFALLYRQWARAALLATVASLAACGGGGGAAPPTVSGTAATGAAIGLGNVSLKCQAGTAENTITSNDGVFTVNVGNATLPCLMRVEYKDSSGASVTLHSVVTAAGTANITPVTELLVAKLLGGSPKDAFDKFDAAKVKALTATQVKDAAAAVKTYLKNTLGVDTTNLPDDPVGTKFTAKSGSANGDAFDKVLDELQLKIAGSGKKLADVASAVAGGGSGGSGGTSGPVTVAGSAIGSGAYSAVDPAENIKFLNLVRTKCTRDDALSDADHEVFKNCTHSNLDPADSNLVLKMYLGALPHSTTDIGFGTAISSGPGYGYAATVQFVSGIAGATAGQACKVGIVEPYIPFMRTEIAGTNKTEVGNSGVPNGWKFRGTAEDTIYVTPGGVVLQYNMTDAAGNKLTVQFNTSTGKATTGSAGNFSGSAFMNCA